MKQAISFILFCCSFPLGWMLAGAVPAQRTTIAELVQQHERAITVLEGRADVMQKRVETLEAELRPVDPPLTPIKQRQKADGFPPGWDHSKPQHFKDQDPEAWYEGYNDRSVWEQNVEGMDAKQRKAYYESMKGYVNPALYGEPSIPTPDSQRGESGANRHGGDYRDSGIRYNDPDNPVVIQEGYRAGEIDHYDPNTDFVGGPS